MLHGHPAVVDCAVFGVDDERAGEVPVERALAHLSLRRTIMSSDVLGGIGASLARVLDHHGIGGARGLR